MSELKEREFLIRGESQRVKWVATYHSDGTGEVTVSPASNPSETSKMPMELLLRVAADVVREQRVHEAKGSHDDILLGLPGIL